jgi:hypothetical protein
LASIAAIMLVTVRLVLLGVILGLIGPPGASVD